MERAESKSSLAQSAWERGVASAASAFDRGRSPLNALQAIIGGAVGFPVGNVVAVNSVALQIVIGGAAGLGTYWAVPVLWSLGVAAWAPVPQRNEARDRVAKWESFWREDEAWRAYERMAYDARAGWAAQSEWLSGQPDHLLGEAVEEWKRRAKGLIPSLLELGYAENVGLIERRLEEIEAAPDVKATSELMQKLATDLINGNKTRPTMPEVEQ